MTLATTDVATRWLVITPTPMIEHWLEAIRVGAATSGLKVMLNGFGLTFDEGSDRPDIMITDDVSRALAVGAENIVALVPAPWSAPEALRANGGDDSSAVLSASRLMAEVDSLDMRHRVIGSDQLPQGGGCLQLFPDLAINVPPTENVSQDILVQSSGAKVLRDMYAHGRIGDQASFTWPVDIFSHHATALIDGRPGEFDLTGRPKFLVSGPYFWMPAGTWTARIRFSIDNDASQRRLRLDWGGVAGWTEQHCTPEHSGTYEMELTHTFSEAQATEIRFLITEGCFSGRAHFHGATISRASSSAPIEGSL